MNILERLYKDQNNKFLIIKPIFCGRKEYNDMSIFK